MPDEIEMHYTSDATKPISDLQLMRLVLKSQMCNYKLDITGLLVYDEGVFFQILEGERDAVHALFAKISKDPRHNNVKITVEKSLPRRIFRKWSQAYLNGDGKTSLA